eukprot:GHRQ01030955.1.p2 GENE.GHRQ01030955.1~~GHRQ01030955.1.p2  ORF type:complete len:126 (-),score=20.59 GHRQ01030955.1:303-680(-)
MWCWSRSAGAKTGWRLAWETMVRELAPQDNSGSYTRPANAFNERIGSPRFPVRCVMLLVTTQQLHAAAAGLHVDAAGCVSEVRAPISATALSCQGCTAQPQFDEAFCRGRRSPGHCLLLYFHYCC